VLKEIAGCKVGGNLKNIKIILLLAVVLFGLYSQGVCSGKNIIEKKHDRILAPVDCQPIGSFEKNETLPTAVIYELQEYNNSFLTELNWYLEDSTGVSKFYVVASLSPTFEQILSCDLLESNQYSDTMIVQVEDTVWFRVYCVDEQGRIGNSSNTVFTIQDTTPPLLKDASIFSESNGDTNWTYTREVTIGFEGEDNFRCSTLEISENSDLSGGESIPVDSCCGLVDYILSSRTGKKIVYVRMVDGAGNVSRVKSAEITLGEGVHNYPNPFNPLRSGATSIVFWLDKPQKISFFIYDLFGNLVVKKIISGVRGMNTVKWDGRNNNGAIVAAGGYLCVIKGSVNSYKHKIVLVK